MFCNDLPVYSKWGLRVVGEQHGSLIPFPLTSHVHLSWLVHEYCVETATSHVCTGNPKEWRSVLSWLLALNSYHFCCFIDIWENFVHLGYPPSCQWLCPRNQWPGHALFCGVFVCVCRYVYTQKARDTLLLCEWFESQMSLSSYRNLQPVHMWPLIQNTKITFSVKYSIRKFASLNGLEINITVHYVVLIYFMYFLDGDLENHDVSQLPKETLDIIEADSFWCMSKLLDGIQVCNAT